MASALVRGKSKIMAEHEEPVYENMPKPLKVKSGYFLFLKIFEIDFIVKHAF